MDRTFRGLIAGLIASFFMNACNLIDYYFIHITHLRYPDWIAVSVSGNKPQPNIEVIIDLVFVIWWDGILGIVFAHLLNGWSFFNIRIMRKIYDVSLSFSKSPVLGYTTGLQLILSR